MVWFQAMSSGSYRPTHVISALPITMPRMLTQMPFRPGTVDYRFHAQNWRRMLAALEDQFTPSIRKPLDIAEVLELCEADAGDATNDLAMLAILYAWLDRKDMALNCCARMQSCVPPILAPILEWEERMKTFGRLLAAAVEAGNAREFMERLIASG
jgi:hypothetical protein